MLTLLIIWLIGVICSSIFINLYDYITEDKDITVGDVIHVYHLFSWCMIIVFICINTVDAIEKSKIPNKILFKHKRKPENKAKF